MSILNKFDGVVSQLNSGEVQNFRLLLSLSASGTRVGNKDSPGSVRATAARCTQDLIARLGHGCFVWRGRIPFLEGDLFSVLRDESVEARKSATRLGNHLFSVAGGRALSFSKSSELREFLRGRGLSVRSSGVASFVYYERPGDRLEPHVDTDNFSVNVLIMLKHERLGPPSHLVLQLADGPCRLCLNEGDCVVFDAGSIVHSREPISYGENVTILTIGMTRNGVTV